MAERDSASDASNIVMPVDSPRRSLRIMNQLRNSPAIRSALKRTGKNVVVHEPKPSLVVDGNNTAHGGPDHPPSSSAIGKGLRSPEPSSRTEDGLRKNLDNFGPGVMTTHPRSGKEFSALLHAHEQKIKKEILITPGAEAPTNSTKVLGAQKHPGALRNERLSDHTASLYPGGSTRHQEHEFRVQNTSASSSPLTLGINSPESKSTIPVPTDRLTDTMNSNATTPKLNMSESALASEPAATPMSNASTTPLPMPKNATTTRDFTDASWPEGTHHTASKVRSHSESPYGNYISSLGQPVPTQRSLIMQTSFPPEHHVSAAAKNLRSSYSRSLISQCTSPALIDSVHSPLGDRRQRSPVNINGAVGKVDLSSEGQQNQSNAEASSNARTRSQRFLRVNPTSEIASHRTQHIQPTVQDTFHGQAEHLPNGNPGARSSFQVLNQYLLFFFKDCSQSTQRSAREKIPDYRDRVKAANFKHGTTSKPLEVIFMMKRELASSMITQMLAPGTIYDSHSLIQQQLIDQWFMSEDSIYGVPQDIRIHEFNSRMSKISMNVHNPSWFDRLRFFLNQWISVSSSAEYR